jgi:hypothetical protein
MTSIGYIEDAMVDVNPDSLDVQVASWLFAGLREWNERSSETLRLFGRFQERLALNIPRRP